MFEDGVLIIDSGFQRHSIWGEKDRIRLIETIMLNMVIPEFFSGIRLLTLKITNLYHILLMDDSE
jgi:hypothetical protein